MSAKVPTVALMCDGHPDEPACVMLPEDMWDVTCKGVKPLIRRADAVALVRAFPCERLHGCLSSFNFRFEACDRCAIVAALEES
jgi:hypothetical protein